MITLSLNVRDNDEVGDASSAADYNDVNTLPFTNWVSYHSGFNFEIFIDFYLISEV